VSIWSERQGCDVKAAARKQENPMKFVTAVLTSALVIAPAALLAQTTTTTPTPGAHDYNIGQRKVDQQDRIANGVKSGQLTAGETSRLEHQEAGINKEERGMRAQDNGHLTSQDRKTLHAQQNQESRRIYRDKHNANVR
jgi:methionine-rich copper-binding protein CopC